MRGVAFLVPTACARPGTRRRPWTSVRSDAVCRRAPGPRCVRAPVPEADHQLADVDRPVVDAAAVTGRRRSALTVPSTSSRPASNARRCATERPQVIGRDVLAVGPARPQRPRPSGCRRTIDGLPDSWAAAGSPSQTTHRVRAARGSSRSGSDQRRRVFVIAWFAAGRPAAASPRSARWSRAGRRLWCRSCSSADARRSPARRAVVRQPLVLGVGDDDRAVGELDLEARPVEPDLERGDDRGRPPVGIQEPIADPTAPMVVQPSGVGSGVSRASALPRPGRPATMINWPGCRPLSSRSRSRSRSARRSSCRRRADRLDLVERRLQHDRPGRRSLR